MKVCRNCGKDFKIKVIIDGRKRNLGNRKFCLDCTPFGCHNTKKCIDDAKQEKKRKHVSNWRRKAKAKLIAYKGGKCEKCGYNKDVPRAYVFHHTNPDEKEFNVGGQSVSLEKLKKEVDKCQLLCVLCHAETHHDLDIARGCLHFSVSMYAA